jgi:demethylmenaquinone methyltransferase/2-methoxy-6-polyprenyl-1,4-benzoquinol methylase
MNVDKSGQRIRRMFGDISPRYDFLNHLLSGGSDYYWRWRAVRAAPPVDDGPILDVCTGTGDLAIAYWKAGGGRVNVVGTDFTHEMLMLAEQKTARLSQACADLTFLEADTQRLPFADGQFQIVSVAFGLRNVSNTEQGLAEMIRVCRPGGRVLVLEFAMPEQSALRAMYRFYFRNVLPRIGQLFSKSEHNAYSYLPESVGEFPAGDALAATMTRCGLHDVTWKKLSFGIAAIYCGTKPSP